ncbi:MAG: 4-alpha-glucanotransferase [Deltaproteobacteria bacterium]|nr:4-alpha-glucanotransferase [Deltaproteobacteria bacterium]
MAVDDDGLGAACRDGLEVLGVTRLALAIHDAAFPGSERGDLGRGTPYGTGGRRLLAHIARFGFNVLQLGPQGELGEGNESPYDGAAFARNPLLLDAAALEDDPLLGGLCAPAWLDALAAAQPRPRERCHPGFARRALGELLGQVRAGFASGPAGAERVDRARAFAAQAAALAAWEPRFDPELEWLLAEQHARLRAVASQLGVRLYADLPIGLAPRDHAAVRHLTLPGYSLGAPPSRTNPEGQAWGYPVLLADAPDSSAAPATAPRPGSTTAFLAARVDRAAHGFDGLRIDHPHGWVCPWVYRDGCEPRDGARLTDSPDLPDHPALASHAIARPEQLERSLARYADGWVRALTPAQIERYAEGLALLCARARVHGIAVEDIACEILSTCPRPLALVIARLGLGRFRVLQKLTLGALDDPYRPEAARPEDWVMIGNHDTPSVWALFERWRDSGRLAEWADALAGRLARDSVTRGALVTRITTEPAALAEAMLATLLASPARRVLVHFTDLFGERAPYNRPGVVHPDNWVLRLAPDFARRHHDDTAAGTALSVPRALALALEARGAAPALASRLRELAPRPTQP